MPASDTPQNFRERLHEIIFEADTRAGMAFDVLLLIMILASVLCVMLESVDSLSQQYKNLFFTLEWFFTVFFTIEYLLRIYCVYRPWRYIFSFYGIIDLLAILPTYLGLLFVSAPSLLIIRALRLMRIFRIFKLGQYLTEGDTLLRALKASRNKIIVFMTFILLIVSVLGALIYLVESGPKSKFSNIPISVYWAIVTMTTVGYGDISPTTNLGRFLAAIVMLLGYAVLAVPTGIVSTEMIRENKQGNTQSCKYCSAEGHDDDAEYCKHCGAPLHGAPPFQPIEESPKKRKKKPKKNT